MPDHLAFLGNTSPETVGRKLIGKNFFGEG
jgi:hypothetical protein